MAQVVKLKRTSVQGRIPSIANLELGELAINTHDGRIFFEKDDGTLSIQEILTTNSHNSGSFNLTGAISASSLSISGDTTIGGNLTLGGNITIGDSDTDSVSFSSDISSSFLPDSNLEFDLGSDTKKWNNLYVGTASADYFVGDGSGITNLQVSSSIVEATTVTSSFDNQSSISVIHNFDSKNVIVSVYDNDYSQIIPQIVTLTDNDTVDIVLSNSGSGHVVIAKGGHLISSNDLSSYRLDVSGNSSYAVSHSLDEEYPFVQAWNTDTKKQEQPLDVESTSPSSLTVTFSGNFAGKIIVKK
jgi:hypothetical protein